MRAFLVIVALTSLAACEAKSADPAVEAAWVRLPAVAGRPGAAYFTLTGGTQADTLLAVSSPGALKAEMHESVKDPRGIVAMTPVRDVAVPAGGSVTFAPAGKHVMLFGVGPAVKAGGKIPLALSFASGRRIDVEASVVGAGDAAPH